MSRDSAIKELIEQTEALIASVRFDDSGFNGQGGNGGLLSPETRQAADRASVLIDTWRKWYDREHPVIEELSTPTPPSLIGHRGNWWLVTTANVEGQPYSIKAPIGDGREHLRRAFEMIGLPAIGARQLDPEEPIDA